MILSNKIETPTWTKLVPGIPRIGKKTNEKVCQKICDLMKFQGTLHHLHFGNKISKNFFFFKTHKKVYFIKLLTHFQLSQLSCSIDISKWLATAGIDTVNLCSPIKIIKIRNENYNLLISPFIFTKKLILNQNNIKRMSLAVAKLHTALKTHPNQNKWRNKTIIKFQDLKIIEKLILGNQLKIAKYGEIIKNLLNQYSVDEIINESNYHILHGDLNPGNILINNEKIYFSDFEDTSSSVLNPIYEIMYLLERLILVKNQLSINKKISYLKLFLKNYCNYTGINNFDICLFRVVQLNILKSFLILAKYKHKKFKTLESEWIKFIYLWELSNKHEIILKRISG